MPARRLPRLLLYALPLWVAVALYGYSITLPFFLDDGPHFLILRQTDGLAHWGDFPAFPFYRPLVFSLWKAYGSLNGGYDPVALHLVNVFCYGLSGVLIGQIVRHLHPTQSSGPWYAAPLAGTLFVLYPFSYQAVAMVAAFFHLLLALGVTLCLWLSLLWARGRMGWPGLIGAWGAASVAIFSHETGVLVVPLLGALLAIQPAPRQRSRRALSVLLLPTAAVACLYVVLWGAFRPSAAAATPEPLTSLAMLIQGIAYPFVTLLRPLVAGDLAAPALLAFALCISGGLLWTAVHLTEGSARRIILYGMGWFGMCILPAALVLPAGYVLGQPRLALLASLGSAAAWGSLVAALIGARRPAQTVTGLILFALLSGVSIEFLGMRRTEFLRLRDWNAAAVQTLEALDVFSSGAVLVNAPDYLTPADPDRRFLLGTEGTLFVDASLDYNQQFWMNTATTWDAAATVRVIGYREIQRSEGFGFRAHPPDLSTAEVIETVRGAPYVLVTQFEGKRFWPVVVGGSALAGSDLSQTLFPQADIAITEAAAALDAAGAHIVTTVRWQVGRAAALKTFVHVYCDGQFIAQSDGYPWGDTYPFAAWRPGEIQTDIRTISLGQATSCETWQVYTGLYAESDLVRLQAVRLETGERYPDDRVPVPFSGEAPAFSIRSPAR